jgi:hypothetical protein
MVSSRVWFFFIFLLSFSFVLGEEGLELTARENAPGQYIAFPPVPQDGIFVLRKKEHPPLLRGMRNE